MAAACELVADLAERLGGASAHEHRGVAGQRLRQRGHGRFVARSVRARTPPSDARPRRYRSARRRAARRRQSKPTRPMPSAARAADRARSLSVSSLIGSGVASGGGAGSFLPRFATTTGGVRSGGHGIGEDPLVLQPDDPADLCFIAHGRRRGRRSRLAAGQADARERKGQGEQRHRHARRSRAPGGPERASGGGLWRGDVEAVDGHRVRVALPRRVHGRERTLFVSPGDGIHASVRTSASLAGPVEPPVYSPRLGVPLPRPGGAGWRRQGDARPTSSPAGSTPRWCSTKRTPIRF